MIYPADIEYTSEPYLGLPPMAEYADHLAIERVLLEALAWTLWRDTSKGVDLVRHVEACARALPAGSTTAPAGVADRYGYRRRRSRGNRLRRRRRGNRLRRPRSRPARALRQ